MTSAACPPPTATAMAGHGHGPTAGPRRRRRPLAAAPRSGPAPEVTLVVDQQRIAAAVREILLAVGEDPDRDGLRATPDRVARMYAEIFAGIDVEPETALTTVFEAEHDEIVLVKDISVASTCEHHLVPWIGVAHVGYIPNENGRITGLSKIARLVDLYARRPQVQERLTTQVADALEDVLKPRGVIVVVEAEHLCMTIRGVRKPGARTVTSAVRGLFRDSVSTRGEAMSLILGR